MHVCTQTACILDVTILTLWEVNLFTEHFFFFKSDKEARYNDTYPILHSGKSTDFCCMEYRALILVA